jgi:hypothetical protein
MVKPPLPENKNPSCREQTGNPAGEEQEPDLLRQTAEKTEEAAAVFDILETQDIPAEGQRRPGAEISPGKALAQLIAADREEKQ